MPTAAEAAEPADPVLDAREIPRDSEGVVAAPTFLIEKDGEVIWRTASGYPDYRSYTAPQHNDLNDQVHFLSSYNLRWNGSRWRKDVPGKAGFHLVLESEWERTIEWNLDYTLASEDFVRRVMEVRIDVDRPGSYWSWYTSPDTVVRFGYVERSLGRWEGRSPHAAMRWEVANTAPEGGAWLAALNASGVGGYMMASPAQAGGTTFGEIPSANLFAVFGKTQAAFGTDSPDPVYFVTDAQLRGRITSEGAWVLGRARPTPQLGAGELLLGRERFLHGVEDAAGNRSRPLIGVDDGGRTALGLGDRPLALEGVATARTGRSVPGGYITVTVNGALALIPYHLPLARPESL